MHKISPDDLVCMNDFTGTHPVRIDLVYADKSHPLNIFKTGIYRPDAKLWLHKDLAEITLHAAKLCHDAHGLWFSLKDGLRPIEAQQAMSETAIVKANPHWCIDGPNRLLSPPGKGGHPRGMAIDITLETESGIDIDCGTIFDYLTPDPADNPAAREYSNLSPEVIANRKKLDVAMMDATKEHHKELLLLPSEWWDFRFTREHINDFEPLSDADLRPDQVMCP